MLAIKVNSATNFWNLNSDRTVSQALTRLANMLTAFLLISLLALFY